MPTETSNPHLTSAERPDLNVAVIKSVADSFIREHGLRDIHTGQLREPHHLDTMAAELNLMMAQPAQGMAQIIPLISFWVSEFSLPFEDELFKLERKRLHRTQSIADQLSSLAEHNQPLEVTVDVSDILAELTPDDMLHAIPLLEEQLLNAKNDASTCTGNPDSLVNRLKNLLGWPEDEIHLSIDAERLFQYNPAP